MRAIKKVSIVLNVVSWFICIFFIIHSKGYCLDPGKKVSQYIVTQWNDETGLPQNSVRVILQTSEGFLWLGTEEGLSRFDGIRFTHFDKNNTPALNSSSIFCLMEDSKKNLWIGTLGGGVTVYRPSTNNFLHYGEKEGLPNNFIYTMVEDHHNNIWLGTDGSGLVRFDGKKFYSFTEQNGIKSNTVRFLLLDHEDNLWICSPKQLTYYKNGKFKDYSNSPDLLDSTFNRLWEDGRHNIWISTDTNLFRKEQDRFIKIYPQEGQEVCRVYSLFEDKNQNLWIGTITGGMIRYSNNQLSIMTKEDGLSDNSILSIYEDFEGSLWIGTVYGGLNRIKDGNVVTIGTKEGLSDDVIFPIIEDSRGILWVGTNNGLSYLKNNQWKYFSIKEGLTYNVIGAICEDHKGRIWVGTDKGLNLLSVSNEGIRKEKDFFKEQLILSLCEDHLGNMWVGTLYGPKKIPPDQRNIIEEFDKKLKVASASINFIFRDHENNLWLSLYRLGLSCYKEGQFIDYSQKNGLPSDALNCIYEDSDSVLWLGSNDGLARLKDGKFNVFTKGDGLFNNNIYQILEDKNRNFWLSCNKGIFYVRRDELNEVAKEKRKSIESVVFGEEDGMRINECNGGFQSAGCQTRDGRLWFPTTKGIVWIDPYNIKSNKKIPPVAIDRVLLDGNPSNFFKGLNFPRRVKRVEIYYTALSFLNPDKVRFKYKLEGYDTVWIDAGKERRAVYTNLEGGEYLFNVIACNDAGLWNTKGASFRITVIPPIWKTWWFTLLALALFSFISYWVIAFFRKYFTLARFWKREKTVGKFRLIDKIGSGGMGTVFKAENTMDKSETVAIKILREEMSADLTNVKRFKMEAAIIDQLDHPNIVKVIERGQSKNNLFIAMEFLEGKTLSQKIKEEKKLNIEEALHIVIQICDAMLKIHSKNIIHRDLKPDNIMLITKDRDPNFVKLLDFGLAKTQFQSSLTQAGVVIGTINYMPPEQITGKGSVLASDVYSLGVMFYEMLTGRKPFSGDTTINIMRQILENAPIEPIRFRNEIPPELNLLIKLMMHKSKESRPSIQEVLDSLKMFRIKMRKQMQSPDTPPSLPPEFELEQQEQKELEENQDDSIVKDA